MLFRPVQQEAAFFSLVLLVVPVIFVGIGVIIAWRSRKEGFRSLVPKFLGIVLGGIPIAYAFGAMMISTAYNYPESFLTQGVALGVGMLIIAIGNAISENFQGPDKKRNNQLKGSHWIILNTLPAAGIGYLLIHMNFMEQFQLFMSKD